MPTTTENKIKYGLKNVHYAVITPGEEGAVTFGAPVRIPGAVNLSLQAQGDETKFYADDIAYYVTTANDGYSGDLEIAVVPDSFRKDVLKEEEDETDMVLVEKSNVETAPFALLFEFDGDMKATRHVLYNCSCGRPSITSSTVNNAKTPSTDTLTVTASPLSDGRVKAKTTSKTPEEKYNGWYQSVWEPAAAGV